jgi:hypothetical protein
MFGLFNQGKIKSPAAHETKLKHGLVYKVIMLFVFGIEGMLGINAAFLVHESASIVVQQLLAGTPLAYMEVVIVLAISLVFGVCLILGGMWVFAGFKDSLEDAKAYVEETGESQWNVGRLHLIKWAVMVIDFATLMFRSQFFAERGSLWLMVFFVVLILLPGPLGNMLYVHEHTPRDRRMSRARMKAEIKVSQDAETAVDQMDPDLLARWVEGDETAYQEHQDRVTQTREAGYEQEQAYIAERNKKQEAHRRPLPLAFRKKQA